MSIGVRIKERRKQNNFTQKKLADLVSVSPQVISNWERGYTDPDHNDVKRLADALDVSADYLLGKSDTPSPSATNNNINNALTEKDEKDIAKRMEKIKEDLSTDDGYMLMGEPMSEEAKESILDAMEYAIRQATRINKKYIPKKHRGNQE
ncbi:helix-turn-helix transcriptional regulator [Priestia aryabhattai]|uniref:helix-turn-helix domain-containing protein n=1 Tax=Priestia aryabhattai TaxID=412384 RepID=UPI001C0E357A|nr:helix-turn-helix transcriptional regulator [Priestia aryabhattai]MBU3569225.1 helix-turn-helix transcriptional regulator [Priestia aryabhattai]